MLHFIDSDVVDVVVVVVVVMMKQQKMKKNIEVIEIEVIRVGTSVYCLNINMRFYIRMESNYLRIPHSTPNHTIPYVNVSTIDFNYTY